MTPEQEARILLESARSDYRNGAAAPGTTLEEFVLLRALADKRALLAEVDRLRESATIWMNALHTACVIVGADTCAGSPSECLEAIRTATSTEHKGETNG